MNSGYGQAAGYPHDHESNKSVGKDSPYVSEARQLNKILSGFMNGLNVNRSVWLNAENGKSLIVNASGPEQSQLKP